MKMCPHCRHENKDRALVCANCGKSLVARVEGTIANTAWLSSTREAIFGDELPEIPEPEPDGIDILLRIDKVHDPLVYKVTKFGLILGRRDADRNIYPDIDFTSYIDASCGLSRRHARLVLNTATQEVEITDMNSTNGTYVNGERLESKTPRYLNQGDEVRLGRLVFHFYYRPN